MGIDRKGILGNFSPENTSFDVWSPFTVGNGDFAFTCDLTGLQTFPALYDGPAIPLLTQAQWGWHTAPYAQDCESFERSDQKWTLYHNGERFVPYCTLARDTAKGYDWLRKNPHRFNLGHVGLSYGERLAPEQIANAHQRLDLYRGRIESRFTLDGTPVLVETCVHPTQDAVVIRIQSALVGSGLGVSLRFPAPSFEKNGGVYDVEDTYQTVCIENGPGCAKWLRQMDRDRYFVSASGNFDKMQTGNRPHEYCLLGAGGVLELVVRFSDSVRDAAASYAPAAQASAEHWQAYWDNGGFIAIGAGGAEGRELQRRILLSQYLTAVQCAGIYPPAETGLTCNSWYGKFHLEMHWWHSAHFPLWQRPQLLARSMWYYQAILPGARALAKRQGYAGARWPKMTDPSGDDSPSNIGPLLIWQQPHPIYYAWLLYRENPTEETLETYRELVVETAAFMADYAALGDDGRYHLGPALIPSQENHEPAVTMDPPFELEYWSWGLKTAAGWLERMGQEAPEKWLEIARNMALPPQADGRYLARANCLQTYTPRFNYDHPSMVGALGILPGSQIDPKIMENTLRAVLEQGLWQIDTGTWGWDFPMLAMTAARLGLPDLAVRALLYPAQKNVYLNNGHNKQADRASLPLYLPGNGGLLMAAAMMCAGWDGCGKKTPGFPESWKVEFENLSPMP